MGKTTTNASYVSTAKPKTGGAVFCGPVGTTLPTDAKSELDTGFAGMGFISDSGVTNSNSRSSGKIKAWGGAVVCVYQSEKTDTFKMTFIESLNTAVLKAVHGEDNVEGELETGIKIKANDEEPEEKAWVIDTIMKGGILRRIVIPRGTITETGDVVYKNDEVIAYEVTISATLDGDGQSHYEYMDKPATEE